MSHSPPSLLAAGALALAVTACGTAAMPPKPPTGAPPGVPGNERPNETQRGAKPPVPRRNPQAVAYEITLKIENAPGPFAVVRARTVYDVQDERCVPRLGGMSGTRVSAEQAVPVELRAVAPGIYQGVVYDELFVDEDYYGLGMCRWNLVGVSISLGATGGAGETRFIDDVFHRQIVAEDHYRSYFPRDFYPRGPLNDMPVPGQPDLQKFRPDVQRELFALDVRIARKSK